MRSKIKKMIEKYEPFKKFLYVSPRLRMKYFLMQRVFRINSHVNWPVHWSSIVTCPEKIIRKSWRPYPGFMPGSYIQAINGIEIGHNVRIGPGVKLISASHDLYDYSKHIKMPPIVIGDNCWLAANVVILPGVSLGDHVVVAAGSVVTKNFSSDCLIGGVPARLIRKLDQYTGDQSVF